MSYDDGFYALYRDYLFEPIVHDRHLFAWQALDGPHASVADRCLELGAAGVISPESWLLRGPGWKWAGIDKNAVLFDARYVRGDYRDLPALDAACLAMAPTMVVSLFSSEITAPAQANRELYAHIFDSNPSVERLLVSGFYYSRKRHINPVVEAGDVVSFQTLHDAEEYLVSGTVEVRLTLPVPSKLFGDDVYEVWRLLRRSA